MAKKRSARSWLNRSVDDRKLIARKDLQSKIARAVRDSHPGCESFVGIIVESIEPKSRLDANWAVKGVRFGRSDRQESGEVVAKIVEQMQRMYTLSDKNS